MSTSVVEGETYVARQVYSGTSSAGPYEILLVRTVGKRQPPIGLSVLNLPSGVSCNGMFRVERIHSVLVRNSKDKNGNWYTGGSVTVKAEVTAINDLTPPEARERKRKERAENPPTEFKTLEDWFKDG